MRRRTAKVSSPVTTSIARHQNSSAIRRRLVRVTLVDALNDVRLVRRQLITVVHQMVADVRLTQIPPPRPAASVSAQQQF